MKHVLRYETDTTQLGKAMELFEAHSALWGEFAAAGTLLAIGPSADRATAMGVFTTREAVDDFIARDPFVEHGVVASWEVWEWDEVLLT